MSGARAGAGSARTRMAVLLVAAVAAAALAALSLAGCSATTGGAGAPTAAAEDAADTGAVSLDGGWAKSAEAGGMTAVFGTLENAGSADLTIAGVESDAAEMVQLHEITADGAMREIEGDVVIPADGSLELSPGGNHIMLMGLSRALQAGDEVSVTLRFDDGTSREFTVLVKDYAGANEEYAGDAERGDHDDAEHEEHAGHEEH